MVDINSLKAFSALLSTKQQECKLQSSGPQSRGTPRTVSSGTVLKQVSYSSTTSLFPLSPSCVLTDSNMHTKDKQDVPVSRNEVISPDLGK